MQWVKHDTDANQDAKLQNVLLDYGLEGYGLYWYCIELIAGKVDKDNITFELEHDARIIARNTGSTPQKVEEMMRYFVEIGLFENSQGVITCLKLAKRLDQSMTSNPKMREIIKNLKCINSHDDVMINHDSVMQDKIRSDKNKDLVVDTRRPRFKFDSERIIPVWNSLGCRKHKGLTQKAEKALKKTYEFYCKNADEPKELNDWLESYLKKGFEKWISDHHRDMGDGQWAADLEFAVRLDTYDKVKNTVTK